MIQGEPFRPAPSFDSACPPMPGWPVLFSQVIAMITEVDNQGIIRQAQLINGRQDTPHLLVQKRDGRVIAGRDTLLVGHRQISENQGDLRHILRTDQRDDHVTGVKAIPVLNRESKR